MGQKTNPNIFRIEKTKTWNSQYFEKKNTETSIYAFKSLEIKKFVYKFFKDHGLIVHECKIHYSDENSLNIFVSYYLAFNLVNLVNSINKNQNVKFIKNATKIESNKKKKYLFFKQNLKKYTNYQNIYYFYNTLPKSLRRQSQTNANTVLNFEKKSLRLRRLYFLKYYKQYLAVKNGKTINRIEANKFTEKFFEVLHLFLHKNIKIFLTVHQLNKNLQQNLDLKEIKLLEKNLVNLKRYDKNDFFKEAVNILFFCTTQKNSASLLAQFIATQIQKLKKHNFFFRFLKTALLIFTSNTTSNLQGIKIKIKGRLNRAPRAKHKIINIGKGVPNLTINSNIDYSEETSFSSNGTFGVKVWTCEK